MDAQTPLEAAATRRRSPFAGIARPVWILSVVSFFADVSSEMVYPIIPLFITGTLGAPAVAVGIVEGVAEGTANLTKLFTGRLADKAHTRKPFVIAGYGLAVVGKAVLGVAGIWPIALVGRTIDRFGKGIRTAPRDALLSDYATPANRGRVFGIHRSVDTMGAVVGPLIGLAFLEANAPLRLVILLAVVPGIASVMVLRWLPRGVPVDARGSTAAVTDGFARLPRSFYVFLGITSIFMLGNSSDAFLILRSRDLGLSTALVVLAYVAYNVTYAAMSLPAGIVSDRIPRPFVLAAGYLVFAGVYAGFAWAPSDAVVWPLFAVYGIYIAFTDGVSKAMVSDLAPAGLRSSAQGLFQGVAGLAALFASIVAGVLWDTVAEGAPFALGAGCALAATFFLLTWLGVGRMNRAPMAR